MPPTPCVSANPSSWRSGSCHCQQTAWLPPHTDLSQGRPSPISPSALPPHNPPVYQMALCLCASHGAVTQLVAPCFVTVALAGCFGAGCLGWRCGNPPIPTPQFVPARHQQCFIRKANGPSKSPNHTEQRAHGTASPICLSGVSPPFPLCPCLPFPFFLSTRREVTSHTAVIGAPAFSSFESPLSASARRPWAPSLFFARFVCCLSSAEGGGSLSSATQTFQILPKAVFLGVNKAFPVCCNKEQQTWFAQPDGTPPTANPASLSDREM